MNWNEPLPAFTKHQGLTIPVYLDAVSVKALEANPELCSKANWLVHIGKAVNTTPPSVENKTLADLVNKLKLAKLAYDELADCNKARIDEFSGSETLQTMIDRAAACLDEPLPKKRKLENLYRTFSTTGRKEWRKFNRAEPTEFQTFMAVVVRLVKDDKESHPDHYVAQVTKAYQRIVLGQIAQN